MSATPPTPSIDKSAETRRVTWIGLFVNVLLSAVKFAVGTVGHSQAVIADAVHSLSDLVTDAAVLLGLRFWSAPADEKHPYGHQRIETMVTVVIGAALLAVGLGIGYNAIATVREQHAVTPGRVAAIGALLSIVCKELLYRWTVAVGRRIRSPAVVANAWHHRSDALSSIPALAAVAVAVLWPRLAFVDHVGALIVSLFIIKVAWNILRPALAELADRGATARDREAIRTLALRVPGVRSVHKLRSRHTGASLLVDLHVLVDGDMTVRAGHDISEQVERAITEGGPDVLDVVVHIEPDGEWNGPDGG